MRGDDNLNKVHGRPGEEPQEGSRDGIRKIGVWQRGCQQGAAAEDEARISGCVVAVHLH